MGAARADGENGGTGHLAWLDLMRFAAAFTVLVGHVRPAVVVSFGALPDEQRSALTALLYAVTRLGNEAVLVFFVLSGYLVGGRAVRKLAAGTFSTTDYALDRLTRIYVPLVPVLAVSALIAAIRGLPLVGVDLAGTLVGLNTVLTHNFAGNGPLWSLAYELWFYVVTGAVGALATTRRLRAVSAALVLLFFLVFSVLSASYLFCWVAGLLACAVQPDRRHDRPAVLVGLALAALGLWAIQLGKVSGDTAVQALREQLPRPSVEAARVLFAAGVALLVQRLALTPPRAAWLRRVEAAGTPLAAFSYTLYLVHRPLLVLFEVERAPRLGWSALGLGLGLTAAALAGAWGLYWLFERRTGDVRRWLRSRLVQGPEAQQRMPST